jgi:hypothetical protein
VSQLAIFCFWKRNFVSRTKTEQNNVDSNNQLADSKGKELTDTAQNHQHADGDVYQATARKLVATHYQSHMKPLFISSTKVSTIFLI